MFQRRACPDMTGVLSPVRVPRPGPSHQTDMQDLSLLMPVTIKTSSPVRLGPPLPAPGIAPQSLSLQDGEEL